VKNSPEKILDQFDEDQTPRWFEHWTVVYLPLALFILGLIFRFQHWPFALLLISSGLMAIMLRNLVFFFSKRRPFGEWAYFVGRMVLFAALILHFAFRMYSIKRIFVALIFFAIGVAIYWLTKNKANDDKMEKLEDDF
jgi:hypothetical protein